MKITKAKGTTGHLLRTLKGQYVFRVYKPGGYFTDYYLWHNDLEITILDDDACFYETDNPYGDAPVLDHAPATLGNLTSEGL